MRKPSVSSAVLGGVIAVSLVLLLFTTNQTSGASQQNPRVPSSICDSGSAPTGATSSIKTASPSSTWAIRAGFSSNGPIARRSMSI